MTTGPDRWATVERLYHAALARPVEDRAAFLAGACAEDPEITRRGRVVAAVPAIRSPSGLDEKGLVVCSVRTNRYERLTDFGEWPVWLPDSRRLLFVSRGKEFHIVDTQTKQTRKIYSSTRDVLGPPQLSHDGRTMYFSRRVTESDIWTRTLR